MRPDIGAGPEARPASADTGINFAMAILLLLVIYLAFIGLGLPDSLLGAAWPMMRRDFGVPVESAGLLSMVILGGTILSSFLSGAVLKRLTAAQVTLLSTAMTAAALMGFSSASSFILLFLYALPLGLGAGSVDAALNYYVARYYRSHHMNWLHCFWGVGAAIGPVILSRYISEENSWRGGYLAVSLLQFAIAAVLLLSLSLWKKIERAAEDPLETNAPGSPQPPGKLLGLKGVRPALAAFLFYCGAETSVGLWGASFLVNARGLPAAGAARWISMYYAGIAAGRFLTGLASFRASNPALIRTGLMVAVSGACLLLLPLPAAFSAAGLALVGLGCAPVFPCMIHETPARFGRENAASIIGLQMGFAYIGSTFLPPAVGLVISHTASGLLPFFVLVFLTATRLCVRGLGRRPENGCAPPF